jgi:exosortase
MPLLFSGLAVYYLSTGNVLCFDHNVRLTIKSLAIVLVWTAGFTICYGRHAIKSAIFPFCFLCLVIPAPPVLLERIVVLLQRASADVAYVLFKLVGVPVFREGVKFSLPGLDIEVAAECSGIRSSMALLITVILAGHMFLRSAWRQLWLFCLTIPITILKNGMRIVALSLLGVYVDRSFLFGALHHRYGGLVSSAFGFAMLGPSLLVLQRSENCSRGKRQNTLV